MFRYITKISNRSMVGRRTFIKDPLRYTQCDPPPGMMPVCCSNHTCPPPPCRPPPCPPPPPKCIIPPNPCCPHYYQGGDKYKTFKYIFLFISLPLILGLTYKNIIADDHHHEKGECREYEYMMRRTKRFPWCDGVKSLFHNDATNHLPGDCHPPPECEDDE